MIACKKLALAGSLICLSSPALAMSFTCREAGLPADSKPSVAVVLNYNLDQDTANLQVFDGSYENLQLEFSPTGRLTHAYLPHEVDFRIQSFVTTADGRYYARLSFAAESSSSMRGQSLFLLCRD